MGRFEGRVAMVTGGGAGLGAAMARLLADEGARVAVVDYDADAAASAATDVAGVAIVADVGDPHETERAFVESAAALGPIDLVVLNAGVAYGVDDPTEWTDAGYERTRRVNLDAVVYGIRAAVRHCPAPADILVTASLAGLTAFPPDPIYVATKHAVVGLVRSLGPTLAADGRTIAAIAPGFADTALVAAVADRLGAVPLLDAATVAAAGLDAIHAKRPGSIWVVQPGRPAAEYEFRGVPGIR